ncbi:MAG: hypothetical protein JWM32_2296 [Verrucomicrobia bacterium]|nr:hypothetical protein [Verrucomicrobiota bacterium]
MRAYEPLPMKSRTTLLAAGLFGATGVALGAFGAHALKDWLIERGTTVPWETAARYQLLHAVALFSAATWCRQGQGRAQRTIGWAALCWSVGIVLFCGSLYGLALGGPRWLGPVTPLGGIALLGGWVFVASAAFAKET